MNLSKTIGPVRVMNEIAAGITTPQNGTHVDMQGFDGVLFILFLGALTATQVTQLKAQGGALVNDSDMADLAGSGGGVVIPDGASNKIVMLDIYRPQQRYIRPVVIRGTANAEINGIIAIQYGGDRFGTGQVLDASVVANTVLASPAPGTP